MPQVQMIESYYHMRCLKLLAEDANLIRGNLQQNIDVLIELNGERRHGSLKARLNIVTRFAWVIGRLDVQVNDFIEYELVYEEDQYIIRIVIEEEVEVDEQGGNEEEGRDEEDEIQTVWDRKGLRARRIRTFEFNTHWIPENETDLYLAFAKTEEYTDFVYCQGISARFARSLRYTCRDGTSKPDAILMHSDTEEYYIAEFKLYSRKFTENHHKEDVDVLICWEDDEQNRDVLPPIIIELKSVVREVARELLRE